MNRYADYLQWIDGERETMIQLLLAWSAINSGSFNLNGLDRMRHALVEAFAPLGGDLEEIVLAPMEVMDSTGDIVQVPLGSALRIRKRSKLSRRIFLGGHMDTVFGPEHPFQKTVWRDANRLNGPGVADLKGGLVVMLKALEALERSPYADAIGWEVLINPDEEIGSPGSAPLLTTSAQHNQLGLIFEPALDDGTLAGARKGSGNFTTVVHGKAAHAGREHHLGRNAVAALAKFISAIDALNGRQPGVTVNPGKIEGGGPVNIVPNFALCHFNIRVATAAEQRWVERQLESICHDINRWEGFRLQLHGGFARPPKVLTPQNLELFEMVAACGAELEIPIQWKATGGCCDGNNLAAAGLPNIDTLGVRGGEIHSPGEFVLIDSLTERAHLSALLLMKLGSGDLDWPTERTGVAS